MQFIFSHILIPENFYISCYWFIVSKNTISFFQSLFCCLFPEEIFNLQPDSLFGGKIHLNYNQIAFNMVVVSKLYSVAMVAEW